MIMDQLSPYTQSIIFIITMVLLILSMLIMFTNKLDKINRIEFALILSIYVIILGVLVDNLGGVVCGVVGIFLYINNRRNRRYK